MTALRASGAMPGEGMSGAQVTGCRLGAGDKVRSSGGTKLATQTTRLTIVRCLAGALGRPARCCQRASRRVSRNDTLDVL